MHKLTLSVFAMFLALICLLLSCWYLGFGAKLGLRPKPANQIAETNELLRSIAYGILAIVQWMIALITDKKKKQ